MSEDSDTDMTKGRDSIHELVCSHHTNEPPAAEDIRAIQGMVRQPF